MQENVAVVRALVTSWQRGNSLAVKAALDPRIEGRAADETASRRGIVAVLSLLETWRSALDGLHAREVEFVSAGDTVVVHLRFVRSRGTNGAAAHIDETQIYRVRNRKVVSVHEYRTSADGRQSRQPVGAKDP
jgi:hypothetical protein